MVQRRGQAYLDVVRDTFMYIPLIESIEQLLQNRDILELVINHPAERIDGFYSDIQTSSVYRQNFQQNQIALPIVLYFDDVEICKPLKSVQEHTKSVYFITVLQTFQFYIDHDYQQFVCWQL